MKPNPCALVPGKRLGPYEINNHIGSGGMGEVYEARDTRLGRTVAIKVLPSSVASDSDRRLRFEREARAASSLNHPHICTIHDFGEHEGQPFIVMERLEGRTLRDILLQGPLDLARLIPLSIQIADALDEQGQRRGTQRMNRDRRRQMEQAEASPAPALLSAHRWRLG